MRQYFWNPYLHEKNWNSKLKKSYLKRYFLDEMMTTGSVGALLFRLLDTAMTSTGCPIQILNNFWKLSRPNGKSVSSYHFESYAITFFERLGFKKDFTIAQNLFLIAIFFMKIGLLKIIFCIVWKIISSRYWWCLQNRIVLNWSCLGTSYFPAFDLNLWFRAIIRPCV